MCATGSYCDNIRATVYQVGLVVEVDPRTIQFLTVTMATLETPSREKHRRGKGLMHAF